MNISGSHSTIAGSHNTPCQSREPVKRNLGEGFSIVEILWKTPFLASVDSFFELENFAMLFLYLIDFTPHAKDTLPMLIDIKMY